MIYMLLSLIISYLGEKIGVQDR